MALLDDVRLAVRTTSTATDTEIQAWIEAAIADMKRCGIDESLLGMETLNPIAKSAVILFCKARYGYDNDEAERFESAYRQTVIDLMGGV